MSLRNRAVVLALAAMVAAPAAARAQGAGGPGCTNLPEYNRALGALQGMTSACDMSVAEACRVLAARGTPAAACPPGASGPDADRPPRRVRSR